MTTTFGQDTLTLYQPISPVAPGTLRGAPRIAEIAPGAHGIMIEPGRPNLLPNPSAAVDTSYWSAVGSGTVSVVRDTTVGLTSGTAVAVTCDGTASGQGALVLGTAAPQGSGVYIGTAWVYSVAGGEVVNIGIGYNTVTGAAPTGGGSTTYTLAPGWQRITAPTLTFGATTSTSQMSVYVETASAQAVAFWVTDAQLETPALTSTASYAPTTFIPGSDPSAAYTWDASNSICTNGSFESGLTGWASTGGATIQASGAWVGSQCLALTGTGYVYQYATAGAQQPYSISFAYQPVSTPATAPTVNISFWSASAQIGATTTFTLPTTLPLGVWGRYAIGAPISPVGTTRIRVQFNGPGASGNTLWDAFQVENKNYATPFGAVATPYTTSASRSQAQVGVSLTPRPGSGVGGASKQCTYMGWSRMGYTPASTSGLEMFCSATGTPYFALSGINFYANVGGTGGSQSLAFPQPVTVGDLLWWACVMDHSANTAQTYIGHAGTWTAGPLLQPTTAMTIPTTLYVGNYYSETPDLNTYGLRSPTAITIFNCAMPVADLQRYWNEGPAAVDPSADSRIVVNCGYGSEQLGTSFWISGQSINASGGVYQRGPSYVGQAYDDDGAGNALPGNAKRFAIPTTPDSPNANTPWDQANAVGSTMVAAIETTDNKVSAVDNWTINSVRMFDPTEIQVMLTRE